MKRFLTAAALSCALITTGCQTISGLVQQTTTASPKQANTLADAINMDTLAVRTTTATIRVAKLDKATLTQIEAYRVAVHDQLVALEKADAAHQSLTFAAFNAAYGVFYNYATSKGVAVQ